MSELFAILKTDAFLAARSAWADASRKRPARDAFSALRPSVGGAVRMTDSTQARQNGINVTKVSNAAT
eukprot:scaffold39914_cov46-Prasinocladus_malaysianus.AAC.1